MKRWLSGLAMSAIVLAACSVEDERPTTASSELAACAARTPVENNETNKLEMLRLLSLAQDMDGFATQLALCAADDEAEAIRLLIAIAEDGSPDAQYTLANYYRGGVGVPRSDVQAAYFYRMAADQGHTEAQYQLGLILRVGVGVPVDQLEGMRRLRQAAEGGHRQAQMSIAEAYQHSDVHRNPEEAIYWYRKAAEQGHLGAQSAIAVRFERGEGVPEDLVRAHMWYNVARTLGSRFSADALERIEANMAREQIFEAQALATRCFNSEYKDCGW